MFEMQDMHTTRQLHELAVAIINSSEGQQTFAINGEWINSGICKI